MKIGWVGGKCSKSLWEVYTVMSKSNATILIANISTMSLQIPQV